tara:strand:+ start:4769 stop:4993 length:225 start_codon:yes stop_codon:yes gene_type:complete
MNLGYLYYNEATETGEIFLEVDDELLSGIIGIDILGDWMGDLKKEYDRVYAEFYDNITQDPDDTSQPDEQESRE